MKKLIGFIEYDEDHIFIRTAKNVYFKECLDESDVNLYQFTFNNDEEFVELKKITKSQAKKIISRKKNEY